MSVQYTDGSFGEAKPLSEAMKEFEDALQAGTAKALHVGSKSELEDVKSKADVANTIELLEGRLLQLERDLNNANGKRGSLIAIPTNAEIEKVCGKDNKL